MDFGLRISDFGFQIANCGLRIQCRSVKAVASTPFSHRSFESRYLSEAEGTLN